MRWKRAVKALAILGLLALTAGVVLWRMTWLAPAWYQPADQADAQVAELAQAVENRLVEEAHRIRRDRPTWTLRIRSEQVNAWLSTRLSRWLVHEQDVHWPQGLGMPQVRITEEGIDLAIELSPEQSSRVVVLRVLPSMVDDRLKLTFEQLSLGRIAMRGYTLDDLIELATERGIGDALQQPEAQWLLDTLAGRNSLDPVATLADNRRVRLQKITLNDDAMDLTLQTLPPEDK